MFPWQHIPESELMQNQAIQLNNDITVTLFLNQSSQNFEVFLKMIISTSVQNFSASYATHSLKDTYGKSGPENQL